MKYLLVVLFMASAFAEEQEIIEDEEKIEAAYFNSMMGGMNPMMDMNPMMTNPGMYNPWMMQQQMGFNPMQHMGMYDPMHSMFSGKVEDKPETEVDSAQFMMPMGGSCGSTCSCRQQCMVVWWVPCNCPPCNGCGCCNGNGSETTQPPPEITPPPTQPPTEAPTTTTCRPCSPCTGCSCTPCRVWFMCAPRCSPSCCNGGGGNNGNCCNSPPPAPPSCCSCPTCSPWMPCKPCKCITNCCPGSNCCSGSGCQDPTTTPAPTTAAPTNPPPIEDPWNPRDPPRNPRDPRDPIILPREPIYRPEIDIREPTFLPPRDRRDQPNYRPSIRDDRWDYDDLDFDFDFRREQNRRERQPIRPSIRDDRWDDDWDLRRDPLEAEFFPEEREHLVRTPELNRRDRDNNFRIPTF